MSRHPVKHRLNAADDRKSPYSHCGGRCSSPPTDDNELADDAESLELELDDELDFADGDEDELLETDDELCDDDDKADDLETVDPLPVPDVPCAVEDPADDAETDDADDTVELDDTTIGGGAEIADADDTDEPEDALTGYFISMFSLGSHPCLFSANIQVDPMRIQGSATGSQVTDRSEASVHSSCGSNP